MLIALLISTAATILLITVLDNHFKATKSKLANSPYLLIFFPFLTFLEVITTFTSIVVSVLLFMLSAFLSGYFGSNNNLENIHDDVKFIDDRGNPFKPVGTYEFNYENMQGTISRRVVDVHKVFYAKKNNTGYFSGYCHQASEYRTFRLDSVSGDVIDLNTGEVISL